MPENNWSSKWPVAPIAEWPTNDPENIVEEVSGVTREMLGVLDWAKSTVYKTTGLKQFKSQGSNLVDTNGYLYLQCKGCSQLLDPRTKSFAELQKKRVSAGWKCIWNDNGVGYKVYCEECKL